MDYSRNVKILTLQGFFVGFSLWAPIAVIYFSKVSGSYALGLSVFSIAMASSAIFEIPTGIFSDRIGRKYTTILGGLFYTLAMVLYAIGFSYGWLIIGAISEGLARSFYSGNNDALLYDSLHKSNKKDELEKWMGYVGGAEQWALGIGAVIGGILATKSLNVVMWLSVTPLLLCFITSFWLIDTENNVKNEGNIFFHLKEAWINFIKNEKLRILSLQDMIGFGLGESSFQFRSVFVAELWPMWAIGLSQMLSNMGAALGFSFSGKILKKFGAINIMWWQAIYGKFANLTALFFPTVFSPALMASTSIFYGSGAVAKASLFQKEFSDGQRATMGSLNSLGKSIFFGIAAIITGIFADIYGPTKALILSHLFGFITMWLTWKLFKLIKVEQ